jgi:hypothetical protein
MALSFGIGAVKKTAARGTKKKTASKKKATPKGRKATAGSKVSASGKRYYPSTPKAKKTYKASTTCSKAGAGTKAGDSRSAAILALCKASVQSLKIKPAALKKSRVQLRRLSTK